MENAKEEPGWLQRIKWSAGPLLSRRRGDYPRVSLEHAGPRPPLECQLGDIIYFEVNVTNTGDQALDSGRVEAPDMVSYHWTGSGEGQTMEALRTPLPGPLKPRESANVRLTVLVAAQDRGSILRVDMVREGKFWFAGVGGKTLDIPVACRPLDEDEPPVPGEELMYAIGYTVDTAWFIGSGRLAATSMSDILAGNGIELNSFEAILDFGCGGGRVLRHLRDLERPGLFGTDYNPDLIDWCMDNLAFAKFQTNPATGELDYPDASFDFIYAFSVFTHLTEPQQCFWIDELSRVLKPGGYLYFTVHGETGYLEHLTEEEQARFKRGELVVHSEEHAGSNVCGAFHPLEYVRTQMAKDLVLVDYVEEGALGNPWQDVVLMRKPT